MIGRQADRLPDDRVVSVIFDLHQPAYAVDILNSAAGELGCPEADDVRHAAVESANNVGFAQQPALGPLSVVPGWDIRRPLALSHTSQVLRRAEAAIRQAFLLN